MIDAIGLIGVERLKVGFEKSIGRFAPQSRFAIGETGREPMARRFDEGGDRRFVKRFIGQELLGSFDERFLKFAYAGFEHCWEQSTNYPEEDQQL